MPGRRHQEPPADPNFCRRCRVNQHAIVIRTEPLCGNCFCKYVQTKVVKRMESFRVQQSEVARERKLLLALSLGPCSTALLHCLTAHLKRQIERTGRTGFKLCIFHISDESREDNPQWDGIRSRFSDHECISIPLSNWTSIDGIRDALSLPADAAEDSNATSQLFDSLPSPTARSDVARILMRRLVVHTAKELGCEAILWGDSTTKLAEHVLAETAKGRGFSLPWVVADGHSPQGIPFCYPMGDLLSSEISAYVPYVEPPITELIVHEKPKPAVSTKNTTIDDLVQQYFGSVEREYPSIVANVVKTTGKLHPVPLDEIEQQCEVCEMPLEGRSPAKSRLCHGCIRNLLPAS